MKKSLILVLLALSGCSGAGTGSPPSSSMASQDLQFIDIPSQLWVDDSTRTRGSDGYTMVSKGAGGGEKFNGQRAAALHTSEAYRYCIRRSDPAQTADEALAISNACQKEIAPVQQETAQR